MGPKKKGPPSWEPNKSVVGDEGCRVRLRRPLPLRACGPRVLRWKTLARFLSSAPWRVRIPLRWAQTKTVPFRGPFPIQWWAMRDVRVRLAPPASASSLRSSRAALENASRFLSSAPWRVRIPLHWAQKGKASIAGGQTNRWWAMRDSNPQPCACKAPALTVAPIARRD